MTEVTEIGGDRSSWRQCVYNGMFSISSRSPEVLYIWIYVPGAADWHNSHRSSGMVYCKSEKCWPESYVIGLNWYWRNILIITWPVYTPKTLSHCYTIKHSGTWLLQPCCMLIAIDLQNLQLGWKFSKCLNMLLISSLVLCHMARLWWSFDRRNVNYWKISVCILKY